MGNEIHMSPSRNSRSKYLHRRDLLSITSGFVGVSALAGCLTLGSNALTVLSAGSLATTFEDYIGPAFEAETDISLHGEYYGSNAIMRMIEDRTKHPDVIVSADATLLRDRLYGSVTKWDIEFASNSVGIGYDENTDFAEQLDAGNAWYDIIESTDKDDVAIADPDLDPLGYRAIQAFKIAQKEHNLNDDFVSKLDELTYREPEEPQIMSSVETGARSAAIVYQNMAVDHEMPFYEFPEKYNFSNPELENHYATVEYTTDEEEYTAEGRPILYNATVSNEANEQDAGYQLIQFLIDNPDILKEAGLVAGGQLPRASGTVPERIDI